MATELTMDKIVSLARRRGFVFPSSEIYGGLGSSYDYGHYGVLLKENVKARWLEAMVQERDDIVALDSAIILHPRIWETSGHVGGFTDPLVDCKTCKLRFRADHLADPEHQELRCGKRPSKRPGETSECDLTEPRQFNLMFETRVGAVEETGQVVYLRPETAQGIFVNFKNVAQLARRKPPFGIAQVGKSFRNEITPGNFIFRTLEFEQMEMEFFVPPAEADEWFRYWIDQRHSWYTRYGIRPENLRVRAHDADELSHYSSATSDIEYLYPIGWSELEGIANRGTFDLTAHSEAAGTRLEWVDGVSGERYIPAVIEPAAGVNRSMLAFLCDAYDEEVVAERDRTVLRLHPQIAPVKVAVLPLIPRDAGMAARARALHDELRKVMVAEHDDGGQIGRRYRRQDEIGTPWALTIDEQTLADDTVTIRDRDSLAQERISIARAREHLLDRLTAPWSPPARAS
jgi:glycyl-tRNA synthetase